MNIDELVGQDFSGVISIRKGKEIIAQNSCGYADINNKVPNEIDTKFATWHICYLDNFGKIRQYDIYSCCRRECDGLYFKRNGSKIV